MSALPTDNSLILELPKLETDISRVFTSHEGGVTTIGGGNVTTQDLLTIVETAGTLDFWNDPDEDIYSPEDGDPT